MKKKNIFRLRFLVMLATVALIAIGFFTATGIGNMCGIGFDSITLLCPLGALLTMIAERTAIPIAIISVVVVLIVCILIGKIFCSWVCPVHFMTWIREKSKRRKDKKEKREAKKGVMQEEKNVEAGMIENSFSAIKAGNVLPSSRDLLTTVPANSKSEDSVKVPLLEAGCTTCKTPCGKSKGIKIDSRHGILAAALGSTLVFGFPVFCLICPIGLTFASVLLTMRLFVFGETTLTIIVFILIILLEILLVPKWCKRVCPVGALLSLFSGLNKTFQPTVEPTKCLCIAKGKECSLCEKVCPEGINLHDIASGETTVNDCSKCKACSSVCPKGAITFPLLPNEVQEGTRIKAKTIKGGEVSCPSSPN